MKINIFLGIFILIQGSLMAEGFHPTETIQVKPSDIQNTHTKDSTSTDIVKTAVHPDYGIILTDSNGMTLYLYRADSNESSSCIGECALTWPPLLLPAEQKISDQTLKGKLGTITRKDGKKQVTYNKKPLYLYIKDTKPGDAKGHNVENKWFIIPLNGPETRKQLQKQ